MFDMFMNSAKLFLAGKLFADFGVFLRQALIAFAIVVAVAVGLSFVNPWLGAIAGGLVGGAITPWLFKDLKYR